MQDEYTPKAVELLWVVVVVILLGIWVGVPQYHQYKFKQIHERQEEVVRARLQKAFQTWSEGHQSRPLLGNWEVGRLTVFTETMVPPFDFDRSRSELRKASWVLMIIYDSDGRLLTSDDVCLSPVYNGRRYPSFNTLMEQLVRAIGIAAALEATAP